MVNLSSKDEQKTMMNSSARSAKYSEFLKNLTSSRLPLSEKRNNVAVAALKWDRFVPYVYQYYVVFSLSVS